MIPGVETFHPRSVWEPNGIDAWYGDWLLDAYGDLRRDSAFHRRPPALTLRYIDYVAVHYTSAIDLPDGDPDEIVGGVDGIRSLLARSHFDYLSNRKDGGYQRLSDGRWFTGYPLGYSFAIDWLGGVWESAGFQYKPAATSGWNNSTLAILMLTDRADPGSDLMWRSFRAICAEAVRRGANIAPDRVWSHGWFHATTGVGTATACCGDALEGQIRDGYGDWTAFDTGDDDMAGFSPRIVKPTAKWRNGPWFVVQGGDTRYADADDVREATANGWPIDSPRDANGREIDAQYEFHHRAVFGVEPS